MATPTPTPKHNPGATPNQNTSSPHLAAVPMGRGLSQRSPAMRTPSGQGHAHPNPGSTPYQAGLTPLAALTTGDEAITLSSPTAALMTLGMSGLTPSPAMIDGHVSAGLHENEVQSIGMSGLSLGGPPPAARGIDEEKGRRLDEVVQLLRLRVCGRGVCREGVERLGRLEGFECMWLDNKLSIAGISVDLEIEFEEGSDHVTDVSLKYATPDTEEAERREEATAVLKRDLISSPEDEKKGRWKKLDKFHANLQRLAISDRLSQSVNCFEAVEGLYESFRRIWSAELERRPTEGRWEHVCIGISGEPFLHKGDKIGLSLNYWVDQRKVLDRRRAITEDDMMASADEEEILEERSWSALIECEEGFPPLRVSKDWVPPEVFVGAKQDESAMMMDDGTPNTIVNWTEPPAMQVPINNTAGLTDPMNRRFVARLEPQLDVPIRIAADVCRVLGINLPPNTRTGVYERLIVPPVKDSEIAAANDADFEKLMPRGKPRVRSVFVFGDQGEPIKRQHGYAFQAFEATVWGCTLRDLPFSHPRQLADIIPVLRQYALLSSLLQRVFLFEDVSGDGTGEGGAKTDAESRTQTNIDLMPNDNSRAIGKASKASLQLHRTIDVVLRTPLSGAPCISLLFNAASGESESQPVTINVEVGLNGEVTVPQTSGLLPDDDASAADATKLCDQLARVLVASEDLGLVAEWAVRWLTRRRM